MTPGPRYRKCTPALWRGTGGMPLALWLSEWLGVNKLHEFDLNFASDQCCGPLQSR